MLCSDWRKILLFRRASIYSYLLGMLDAMKSCMILIFIRKKIWSIACVGFATHTHTHTHTHTYIYICRYLNGFILLFNVQTVTYLFWKWFGRCRNNFSLLCHFSWLVYLRLICFLSYMLYIFHRVLIPGPLYVVYTF